MANTSSLLTSGDDVTPSPTSIHPCESIANDPFPQKICEWSYKEFDAFAYSTLALLAVLLLLVLTLTISLLCCCCKHYKRKKRMYVVDEGKDGESVLVSIFTLTLQ